ncbi:MAG: hypothetical protein DRI44_08430 [Chlamydiae bacterium]|nr:MAG: hypothetical protein DRI44_08430 [Chlamydiota bacterium]
MEKQLKRIQLLRQKVKKIPKFEKITAVNWNKTTGIILRLLERAEQTLTDILPKPRFDWERSGYTSQEIN